jgi:hypothetical protein
MENEHEFAGAKFKIVNGIIQLNNQSPTNNTNMSTNETKKETKKDKKATPTIKVAKPVKSTKSVPIKPTKKAIKQEEVADDNVTATAVQEVEAAPTPADDATDAEGKQEAPNDQPSTKPKSKRERKTDIIRTIKAPFDPMAEGWKPTCKFGTAMKRAKKWLTRWKGSKDDEKKARYYRAAIGFVTRAIEKASNEVETNEAKELNEAITNA